MHTLADSLFTDLFTIFSTMDWVRDFFKTNPHLSYDETYYTMRLNNCVNRTAQHLINLQEIINARQTLVDVSKEQNAINYISKFLEVGSKKKNEIAVAFTNFVNLVDANENLEEILNSINSMQTKQMVTPTN